MLWTLITIGCAIVLVMLALRAWQAWRTDVATPRGTAPGKGYTVIESHYISGGGGGGQSTTYTVPKDPQEYARTFVPKDRRD